MNPRRLYRCRHDRSLAGVAAGMAEYLDLDPTVVRVLWIVSAIFTGGLTILLYILLAFVMPMEPLPAPAPGSVPGTGPGAATEGATSATGATGPATADDPTAEWTAQPGWTSPTGETVPSAWVPAHQHAARPRGEGRMGLAFGILLVVFGAIALVGPVFPGWVASIALGPAFVLALGVALVIVAARRPAPEP